MDLLKLLVMCIVFVSFCQEARNQDIKDHQVKLRHKRSHEGSHHVEQNTPKRTKQKREEPLHHNLLSTLYKPEQNLPRNKIIKKKPNAINLLLNTGFSPMKFKTNLGVANSNNAANQPAKAIESTSTHSNNELLVTEHQLIHEEAHTVDHEKTSTESTGREEVKSDQNEDSTSPRILNRVKAVKPKILTPSYVEHEESNISEHVKDTKLKQNLNTEKTVENPDSKMSHNESNFHFDVIKAPKSMNLETETKPFYEDFDIDKNKQSQRSSSSKPLNKLQEPKLNKSNVMLNNTTSKKVKINNKSDQSVAIETKAKSKNESNTASNDPKLRIVRKEKEMLYEKPQMQAKKTDSVGTSIKNITKPSNKTETGQTSAPETQCVESITFRNLMENKTKINEILADKVRLNNHTVSEVKPSIERNLMHKITNEPNANLFIVNKTCQEVLERYNIPTNLYNQENGKWNWYTPQVLNCGNAQAKTNYDVYTPYRMTYNNGVNTGYYKPYSTSTYPYYNQFYTSKPYQIEQQSNPEYYRNYRTRTPQNNFIYNERNNDIIWRMWRNTQIIIKPNNNEGKTIEVEIEPQNDDDEINKEPVCDARPTTFNRNSRPVIANYGYYRNQNTHTVLPKTNSFYPTYTYNK